MKFSTRSLALLALGATATGAVIAVRQQFTGQASVVQLSEKSVLSITVAEGYRTIDCNGIPNHNVGRFPGPGNPNKIVAQAYHFRVPVAPQPKTRNIALADFGVAVNGVPFDPGTAETWNGDQYWKYEALSGFMADRGGLGVDTNYGHVQPNGAYHYHGLPMGLLEKLDYKHKMALVGWAADGYPIYGPYAYSDPQDPKSGLKKLKSGYRLREGNRSDESGPSGAYDGSFRQDYEWVQGFGDLDEYNGRLGVTPEFPQGTFYYVLTDTFPFVPRKFKGQPDPSFAKGRPR